MEKLVSELALTPYRCENIILSSFRADKPLYKQMDAVLLQIQTDNGELVQLTALVVPTIATLISNPLDTAVATSTVTLPSPPSYSSRQLWNFTVYWCQLLLGAWWRPHCAKIWTKFKIGVSAFQDCTFGHPMVMSTPCVFLQDTIRRNTTSWDSGKLRIQ